VLVEFHLFLQYMLSVKVKEFMRKSNFLIMVLTLILTLSATSLILAIIVHDMVVKDLLVLTFILNFSGSTGDILYFIEALKSSSSCQFRDMGTCIELTAPPRPLCGRLSRCV